MTVNRTTPGWGKAIGILMIVFGSLGFFIQIYKMMLPQLVKTATFLEAMDQAQTTNPFQSQVMYREMMNMGDQEAAILFYAGLIGLLGIVVYIIGGAKLLKATPANFNFARFTLFGFIVLNTLTTALLIKAGPSFLSMGAMVYIILGIITDLVLLIVLVSNDKTRYGIGVSESAIVDTVYKADDVL